LVEREEGKPQTEDDTELEDGKRKGGGGMGSSFAIASTSLGKGGKFFFPGTGKRKGEKKRRREKIQNEQAPYSVRRKPSKEMRDEIASNSTPKKGEGGKRGKEGGEGPSLTFFSERAGEKRKKKVGKGLSARSRERRKKR